MKLKLLANVCIAKSIRALIFFLPKGFGVSFLSISVPSSEINSMKSIFMLACGSCLHPAFLFFWWCFFFLTR